MEKDSCDESTIKQFIRTLLKARIIDYVDLIDCIDPMRHIFRKEYYLKGAGLWCRNEYFILVDYEYDKIVAVYWIEPAYDATANSYNIKSFTAKSRLAEWLMKMPEIKDKIPYYMDLFI